MLFLVVNYVANLNTPHRQHKPEKTGKRLANVGLELAHFRVIRRYRPVGTKGNRNPFVTSKFTT